MSTDDPHLSGEAVIPPMQDLTSPRPYDAGRGLEGMSLAGISSPAHADGVRNHVLVILDQEGRIQEWPREAERMVGYSADEVRGEHLSVLYPPEELLRTRPEEEIRSAIEGGRSEAEGWWVRRDGTRLWGRRLLYPVRLAADEVPALALIFFDFSTHRESSSRSDRIEQYFRSLYDHSPDPILCTDLDGRVVSTNTAADALLGGIAGDPEGTLLTEFFDPQHRPAIRLALGRAAGAIPQDLSVHLRGDAAEPFGVTLVPVVVDGCVCGYFVVLRAAKSATALEPTQAAEGIYQVLVEKATQGLFYLLDAERKFRYVSPSVGYLLGYTPEALLGLPAQTILPAPSGACSGDESPATYTSGATHRNGNRLILEISEIPICLEGATGWTHGFVRDVTREVQMEQVIAGGAMNDSLTGLPAPALLWQRMQQVVRQAKRRPSRYHAVLLLELSGLKQTTEMLGHFLVDQLVVEGARRIEGCLRPADTVCRIRPDTFLVLLEEMRSLDDAARVAQRIVDSLEAPFSLGGVRVAVPVHTGLARVGIGSRSPDELIHKAGEALYRAKSRQSGTCETVQIEGESTDRPVHSG